jgi:hypothetical protein
MPGPDFLDANGIILAAADRGACVRILSEDLITGQSYFGIMFESPFA